MGSYFRRRSTKITTSMKLYVQYLSTVHYIGFCTLQFLTKISIMCIQPLTHFGGWCTHKKLIIQAWPVQFLGQGLGTVQHLLVSNWTIYQLCLSPTCSILLLERIYQTWPRILIAWVGDHPIVSLVFAALHSWFTTGWPPTQVIRILDVSALSKWYWTGQMNTDISAIER